MKLPFRVSYCVDTDTVGQVQREQSPEGAKDGKGSVEERGQNSYTSGMEHTFTCVTKSISKGVLVL